MIFCLKIRFLLHFVFFSRPAFSPCDFFPICFHQKLLTIFTKNETFCKNRGILRVSALCDLSEISLKNFKNFLIFFLKFQFFERFCCLQFGKKWFSSLMRIPWGIFWNSKIVEISAKVSFCIFKKHYFFEAFSGAQT